MTIETRAAHKAPHLPPLLRYVASIAGVDAAERLAMSRAGRNYIPKSASALSGRHWLVIVLGRGAAGVFLQRFGGQVVKIPPALPWRRRQEARCLHAAGKSNREIAAQLGITPRRVSTLVRTAEA